jgi:hypothetical protein
MAVISAEEQGELVYQVILGRPGRCKEDPDVSEVSETILQHLDAADQSGYALRVTVERIPI